MATSTWSSNNLHTTTAEFRTWGSEMSAKFQAMGGLTLTGDTGQINWTTVTLPANGVDGGYEIYYLNDSIHSTSPIYFKIYYGSGGNTGRPRMKIEVGTGSNGSGTLTGNGSGTTYIITADNTGSATSTSSYLCVNTGFVGLMWKVTSSALGGFFICRSADADGTPNSKGCILVVKSNSSTSTVRCWRFEATAAVYTADTNGAFSFIPQNMTSSTVGADKQVFLGWMAIPDVRPVFGACVTIVSEYSGGTTFSVALVGTTARTYISGVAGIFGYLANSSNLYSGAMLWD